MAETRKEHNTAPVKEKSASALKALEDEVRAFIDSNFDSLTERQKAKLRVLLGVLTLRDDAELLRGMKEGFPATEEGLRAFLKEVFAYSEERRQRETDSGPQVELVENTKLDGLRTLGDNEFLYQFFEPVPEEMIGRKLQLSGKYKKARLGTERRPASQASACVTFADRFQYFERDVYFTFCNLGWKNVTKDGKTCVVTVPGMCRELFGTTDPTDNEKELVKASIERLRGSIVENVSISGGFNTDDLTITGIKKQPFLSFSEAEFVDRRNGLRGDCYLFPSNSLFIIYEIAKSMGRIKEFSPKLIPARYNKTEESYSLFCRLRDRMSFFNPKRPEAAKVLYDDMLSIENPTRDQRYKNKTRIQSILRHWAKIGACTFDPITATIRGKEVEVGYRITAINEAVIFGKALPCSGESTQAAK